MDVLLKAAIASLVAFTLIAAAALVALNQRHPTGGIPGALKGVTLTPKSFQGGDFETFLDLQNDAGEVVSWAGDWAELGEDDGAPATLVGLAKANYYIPVVEAQFFDASSGELLRPLNAANKALYIQWAEDFCREHKPQYLALGIEVNILQEKSPADYVAFVGLFADAYDAVKSVSPGTKVFTVFQLERMKGLKGGLFGGMNGSGEWELLDDFPDADLTGFTTYPCLVYKDPSGIPEDYYSSIGDKTDKRPAFTEVGWHAGVEPMGWESSEGAQAQFVETFFDLVDYDHAEMVIWAFMFDQPGTPVPFSSMGLWTHDGEARPAWEAWKEVWY
ncbi:MAG: hypothetical protein V1934_03380 [Methanobacteriota archaeon]